MRAQAADETKSLPALRDDPNFPSLASDNELASAVLANTDGIKINPASKKLNYGQFASVNFNCSEKEAPFEFETDFKQHRLALAVIASQFPMLHPAVV